MMCGLMHLIFTSFASKATAASENLAAVAHNNMLLLHTEASNSHTKLGILRCKRANKSSSDATATDDPVQIISENCLNFVTFVFFFLPETGSLKNCVRR